MSLSQAFSSADSASDSEFVQASSRRRGAKRVKPSDSPPDNVKQPAQSPFVLKINPLPNQVVMSKFLTSSSIHLAKARPLRDGTGYLLFPKDSPSARLLESLQLDQVFPGATIHRVSTKPKPSDFCFVIANMPLNIDEDSIIAELDEKNDIKAVKAFRITSKATNQPTKLVRVITRNEMHFAKATAKGVFIGFSRYRCEKGHERAQASQCFECQGFGHLAKECTQEQRCPRCGENHKSKECKTDRQNAKCCNCGGSHSSAYRGCPKARQADAVAQAQATHKTFASAVKTTSFQPTPLDLTSFVAHAICLIKNSLAPSSSFTDPKLFEKVSKLASEHFRQPVEAPEVAIRITRVGEQLDQARQASQSLRND